MDRGGNQDLGEEGEYRTLSLHAEKSDRWRPAKAKGCTEKWVSLSQLTYAGCACDICCVAQPAVAAEGANAVDALSILAEVGKYLAFIDVCRKEGRNC